MFKDLISWLAGSVSGPKWLWLIMLLCMVVTIANSIEDLWRKISKREK